jgi:hypothetical protein
MKHKKLAYVIIPVLGAGIFLGLNTARAEAFSGLGFRFEQNATPEQMADKQQKRFQNEADILGISVDDVKNAWAEGKTLPQIMQEKGISQATVEQKLKDKAIAEMKTRLKTLVDKGVITQAQADKRSSLMLSELQNKTLHMNGKGMGRGLSKRLGGI